jgi:hypothetical protein
LSTSKGDLKRRPQKMRRRPQKDTSKGDLKKRISKEYNSKKTSRRGL